MKSITLVGNGNMALSIAQGLKENYTLEVIGRDIKKLDAFEETLGVNIKKADYSHAVIEQKSVILCVKPANITEIANRLHGEARVIYSVLAGVQVQTLKNALQTKAVVRAMPNLAASVQRSMTTLTGDEAFKEEAITLFNHIGSTLWLASEKELNIATALAGSGPAYLALMAEALADGAVKNGLKRQDAMEVMRGLFGGFGELIQTTHPALLKDGVMSPGGTTAAGYAALEESGVRSGCIKAIDAAYNKAKELS